MSFEGEDSDEKIILLLRRHFIVNLRWAVESILLILVPTILSYALILAKVDLLKYISTRYVFVFYVLWYITVFGFLFEQFLVWFFNVYIVTNKRIVDMDFHGLLHRDVAEAPLRNIEDITRSINGAAQVVFNYGNVVIQTAGEQRELEFEEVPDPARVQDIISDLVSEIKFYDHS